LLHGLGATKASWLPVIPALARSHRVIAIDLPGFGASSKPLATYDAPCFAGYVSGLLDELGITRAFIAGNSMGGRVAMEMAMRDGGRVSAITCLCPAAAFTRRPAVWLARFARPELGIAVTRLPRGRVRTGLEQLFADPRRIDARWFDAAIDDFMRTWRSPRARRAFWCALRNIYLDEPNGDGGFWARLGNVDTPALFVYGRRDVLITSRFGTKMQQVLPHAQVEVWDDCGHVPQLECPDRTAATMVRFFRRVSQPTSRPA
jgi:pimeloyl-ACP methyl ester carboxylesterase